MGAAVKPTQNARQPERLGKYELNRRLAVGGMAEIHLARATGIEGFEKIVVVKRILPELSTNQEFVQMFLGEARLAATLHHPKIAQVYDAGAADGGYFFAMEHIHGEDLRAVVDASVRQHRYIPFGEAISIGLGICAGLHYAHESIGFDGSPLGIIHRDVSLSNVLVSYDGCTKLVDFGIAKATTTKTETHGGAVRGKLSYLSPEQCRCEPLDRRSDIFSIGIVLYELTTCRRLFRGNSEFGIMKAIVEGPIMPPSLRRADYPRELEAIVLKTLARKRESRYQTAQELQLALEGFAREHKLAVSSVSLGRLMEELFAPKLEAWRAAQRQGKPLGEHLASAVSGEVARRSGSGPSVFGVADTPVTKREIPVARSRGTAAAAASGRPRPCGRARRLLAAIVAACRGAGLLAMCGVGLAGSQGALPPAAVAAGAVASTAYARAEVGATASPAAPGPATAAVVAPPAAASRPRPEAAPALAPEHEARTGWLDVRIGAGAARWSPDHRPAGDGTGRLYVELTPGRHLVKVEAKGFRRRRATLEVPAQGTRVVSWSLKPDPSSRQADRRGRGWRDPNAIDRWPLR